MSILFSIVFGLLFGMMIGASVGFIKPKWVHKSNRKEVLKFVGILFILVVVVALFVPENSEVNSTANLLAFLFGLWIPFWDLKKWETEEVDQYLDDVPVYTEKKEQEFNKHLIITYRDAKGNKTQREINILSSNKSDFYAYCHLRREERSFKVSNIIECVDADTGEVVSDIRNYFK